MAKHRRLDTKFWSDCYISELDPIEKLLFIYFITNQYTNICGIYELSLKQIALDTGIDKQEMLPKIIKRFSDAHKIYYIDGRVYIRNFQKHQDINNKRIVKGIENGMNLIPEKIKKTIGDIDTLYIGYTYPLNNSNLNLNLNSNIIKEDIYIQSEKQEKKEQKKKFLNNVLLTEEEYNSLLYDFGQKRIDDIIESLNEYIVNNPKGQKFKDHNLVIRKRLKNNGVKKKEHKEIQKITETDDFFTSIQKEIGN